MKVKDSEKVWFPTVTPGPEYRLDGDVLMEEANGTHDVPDARADEEPFCEADGTLVDDPDDPNAQLDEEPSCETDGALADDSNGREDVQDQDFVPSGSDDGEGEDEGDEGNRHRVHNPDETLPTPWSKNTLMIGEMEQLGICVDTAARVIVCISCASAVNPTSLTTHIKTVHPPLSTTSTFAEELVTKYELWPNVDRRPGFIIPAIHGLPVLRGFTSCNVCGYACESEQTMKRHLKKFKDCKGFGTERPVQTLLPGSGRLYFAVTIAPEPVEDPSQTPLDPVTYLTKKYAPTPFRDIPIESPRTPMDANHFLTLEKWDVYVRGKTGADIELAVRTRAPELRSEVRICMDRFADLIIKELGPLDPEKKRTMGDYVG